MGQTLLDGGGIQQGRTDMKKAFFIPFIGMKGKVVSLSVTFFLFEASF